MVTAAPLLRAAAALLALLAATGGAEGGACGPAGPGCGGLGGGLDDGDAPALELLQRRATKESQRVAAHQQDDAEEGLLDPVEGFATMGLLESDKHGSADPDPDGQVHADYVTHSGNVPGDAMTMWSKTEQAMVGSSCQFADAGLGGLNSPAAQTPLIKAGQVCAVNKAMFENGFACGRCYRISFTGALSTDAGRAGSDLIQVVDSGSWRNFDCIMPAFNKITGARTGIFQIKYKQEPCPVEPGGARVTVAASSYYFMMATFSNLPTPARRVFMMIDGGEKLEMAYLHSAVFQSYTGTHKGASFQILTQDGARVDFEQCLSSLPARQGAFCTSSGAHHGGPPTPTPQPSHHYTPTPGHDRPHTPQGGQCLARFEQCGGPEAGYTARWSPGSSLRCCGEDDRGPMTCTLVNRWFSQCRSAHGSEHAPIAPPKPPPSQHRPNKKPSPPEDHSHQYCLGLYQQCGGEPAANSNWRPGNAWHCCWGLSCQNVNPWLDQCL